MEPSATTPMTPAPPAPAGPDAVSVAPTGPPPEAAVLEQLLFEIKKVIVGQDRAIERMLACLIAGGRSP